MKLSSSAPTRYAPGTAASTTFRVPVLPSRSTSRSTCKWRQAPAFNSPVKLLHVAPLHIAGASATDAFAEDAPVSPVLVFLRQAASFLLGGMLIALVTACLALWNQAPTPLMQQGTQVASILQQLGLAPIAKLLTKQQALAVAGGLFMFKSTALGPVITLGDRNRPTAAQLQARLPRTASLTAPMPTLTTSPARATALAQQAGAGAAIKAAATTMASQQQQSQQQKAVAAVSFAATALGARPSSSTAPAVPVQASKTATTTVTNTSGSRQFTQAMSMQATSSTVAISKPSSTSGTITASAAKPATAQVGSNVSASAAAATAPAAPLTAAAPAAATKPATAATVAPNSLRAMAGASAAAAAPAAKPAAAEPSSPAPQAPPLVLSSAIAVEQQALTPTRVFPDGAVLYSVDQLARGSPAVTLRGSPDTKPASPTPAARGGYSRGQQDSGGSSASPAPAASAPTADLFTRGGGSNRLSPFPTSSSSSSLAATAAASGGGATPAASHTVAAEEALSPLVGLRPSGGARSPSPVPERPSPAAAAQTTSSLALGAGSAAPGAGSNVAMKDPVVAAVAVAWVAVDVAKDLFKLARAAVSSSSSPGPASS